MTEEQVRQIVREEIERSLQKAAPVIVEVSARAATSDIARYLPSLTSAMRQRGM